MSVDPKTLQPGRFSGPPCDRPVGDGTGAVSWPCKLRKGHDSTDEPCYAIESPIAMARWQMWAAEHLVETPTESTPTLQPLTEHEHDWEMASATQLRCTVCGELVNIAEPPGQRDLVADQFSASTGAQAAIRKDALQAKTEDTVADPPRDPEIQIETTAGFTPDSMSKLRLESLAMIQAGDYVAAVDKEGEWIEVIRISRG
jgi:hypothetical protein